MVFDTLLISRIQFAFTISFHILFPAFSIGLVIFLSIMEGLWLKTRDLVYLKICKFWTKVFALTFGMGVVSGIVMEFQFGTNWGGFAHQVGGVLGALFTYEVMTAFFMEAGFLGVMLFGWKRVSPRLHYAATLLVAAGTTISAYWIIAANSWMQHPVGYHEVKGLFEASSWLKIVFNPINFPRFIHMLLASYICTSFVIVSVSGYYLLRKKHELFAKKCFQMAWLALLILLPSQIMMGDVVGRNVHQYQPIKTAAIEGVWNTQRGAPFLVFAVPDQVAETNHWALKVPHVGALINTHQWNGQLVGLKSVPRIDRPNVALVFYSFRVMVYLGVLMLLLAMVALYLRLKKKLYNSQWFLRISVLSAPFGFIALWCGWITTEEGRQPWAVYHLLRTSAAFSAVPLHDVIISLVLIVVVYGVIFGYFYFYFLHKLIKAGPLNIDADYKDQSFQYMAASTQQEEPKK